MGSPFVRTFLLFILLHVKGTHVLATRCPDGRTICDAESTCCPVSDQYLPQANRWPVLAPLSAKFGCCPLANAVCCTSNSSLASDSQSWCCPSGFTCNLKDGTCSQKVTRGDSCEETNSDTHSQSCSCPTGSFFNNTSNQCQSALSKVQVAANTTQVRGRNLCPGGEYRCPEGDTCCKLDGGLFGCCQGESAVCCDDKLHCCPNGYECTAAGCRKV